jgi:hypothetical protein
MELDMSRPLRPYPQLSGQNGPMPTGVARRGSSPEEMDLMHRLAGPRGERYLRLLSVVNNWPALAVTAS